MASTNDPGRVVLGYVAGAHGLKGEVRIQLFHEGSEALRPGATLMLIKDGTVRRLSIARMSRQGGLARVAFSGIADRDAAEALARCEVSIDRAALPALADDEVYLSDLVGLRAMEGEREVGVIEAVLHHPASDCAVIREPDGAREVPLREPYLVSIDLIDRVVRFALLEDFEKTAG